MERIWKLAVYIFWIVASTALILLAYVLSGNQYSAFAVIMVYAGLAGLAIGIFGGIISGIAISLCLLMDATTGGTDFIAIFLSDKKGVDSFNIILCVNVVILSLAGLLFGWDKALYSIIFQFVSTQVLHTLYKKYQRHTLFIVTNHEREVCEAISRVSHHGATILDGKGSFEFQERNVVYSVVSRAESKKVVREVKKLDPNAFINVIKTDELAGRFYQKPTD